MRSRTPKVLHDLCGRPMIAWPVAAALAAGAGKVVVVDGPQRPLEGHLPEGVELAVQPEANGTGGAVQAAAEHLGDEPVLVLNGDVPLVTAEALADLLEAHAAAERAGDRRLDGARRPDGLRARRAPRRRVRGARGGDQGRGRRHRRAARHPRGQRRRLRLRRRRPQGRARAPDPRQRPGRALPALDARAARPRRRPSASTTPRCCSASTTAPTSRASARSPRPASTARTCAPASRSSTRPARSSTSRSRSAPTP